MHMIELEKELESRWEGSGVEIQIWGSCVKARFRWIEEMNIRVKNHKTVEQNAGENLSYLGFCKDF